MEFNPTKKTKLEQARDNVWPRLNDLLLALGIDNQQMQLYLRAFKAERELEIWVRSAGDGKWQLLTIYSFCSSSGSLGPKRREGDLQIPEGFYHIDRFNPNSKFHLSLGLNYPNLSDQLLGDANAPGSDIFIHGGCQTVGCIPVTDPGIEEVYILADWAKENGQNQIPVHLFPFRFTDPNWQQYGAAHPEHRAFWQQLEVVHAYFETRRILPQVIINEDGCYSIN